MVQGLILTAEMADVDIARVIEAGRRLGAEVIRRPVRDHGEFLAALDEFPQASFILADFLPDVTEGADSGVSYAFSRVPGEDSLSPEVRATALRRVAGVRWIQLGAVGVNQEAASFVWRHAPSIAITTASGLPSVSMAQYVIGAILDHAHGFSRLASYRAARDWSVRRQFRSRVLVGKTLGLLGYGGVGARAARIAHALGMRVIAVRRSGDDPAGAPARFRTPGIASIDAGDEPAEIWGLEGLDQLLGQSDYFACTVPLTAATQGMIGARELSLLPAGAYVINVSRGAIFDQDALIAALRSGQLAGATLDVFDPEPLPADSPIWELPNVVVTPHSSGTHDHVSDFTADLFIANMERFVAGQPLLNLADRTLGY
jgi:phosphoglycerate dehydrogenase-like enzyme